MALSREQSLMERIHGRGRTLVMVWFRDSAEIKVIDCSTSRTTEAAWE